MRVKYPKRLKGRINQKIKTMNSLTFLNTQSNSKVADMDNSILLSVIHDEINTGSYFVETATNGGNIQISDFSFLPGTIQNTFDIDANQFVTYIN